MPRKHGHKQREHHKFVPLFSSLRIDEPDVRKDGALANGKERSFCGLRRDRPEEVMPSGEDPRRIKRDGKIDYLVLPHEEFDLAEKPALRRIGRLKSPYEKAAAEVLLRMGLEVKYEPLMLKMDGGGVWDPDFFINLFVGGKQVVIETHNLYYPDENGRYGDRMDAKKTIENYLKRMGETLASHGEHAYLVLVDSHILDGTQPHVELDIRRGGKKCVDEHWHMPRISFSGDVIDHQSYEQWKRWFGTFLSDLVENRADK